MTNNDNLDVAMRLLSRTDIEEIAVVDEQESKNIVGSIHRQDVIRIRNEESLRRDLSGTLPSTISLVGKVRQVEIGDGYVMQEILVPATFVGKTLGEINLKARTGLEVVFVRTKAREDGHRKIRVPSSQEPFENGDSLIIAGHTDAMEQIETLRI